MRISDWSSDVCSSDLRIGWNVVTSMFDAEARNHGYDAMPDHDWRYARAEEFIQVVLALWDSWDESALLHDRQGAYADPAAIHPIHHKGDHFRVDGPLTVPHPRSEEHPSELQSLMRSSYAVFC